MSRTHPHFLAVAATLTFQVFHATEARDQAALAIEVEDRFCLVQANGEEDLVSLAPANEVEVQTSLAATNLWVAKIYPAQKIEAG